MDSIIQPRVLKGFRDYLPDSEIIRAELIAKLARAFYTFGFVPIDTPALEYAEILLRKSDGETEKQVFRFQDSGGRDVALRFDLTVPFARFIAEHKDELYFPFKRYHIAKVWRGEKPQAGRFREFMQCDFDIVGSESASSDFEILNLMKTALNAIGVKNITIRLSHRGVFNAFLTRIGQQANGEEILRIVDKLAKIGRDAVCEKLVEITGSAPIAKKILVYVAGAKNYDETLALMEELAGSECAGVLRLRELRALMNAVGIADTFVLDPSITRGLDYYTGVVFETFLNDLPAIGSVCSGGRYDNLAGLYMKDRVPGVGSSIGLDRLLAALEQLDVLGQKHCLIDAEIFCLDESLAAVYQKAAVQLRKKGVVCEVFPDAKKIGQQYAYAEKKGIPFGIFVEPAGTAEAAGTSETIESDFQLSLKYLPTREQTEKINAGQVAKLIALKAMQIRTT